MPVVHFGISVNSQEPTFFEHDFAIFESGTNDAEMIRTTDNLCVYDLPIRGVVAAAVAVPVDDAVLVEEKPLRQEEAIGNTA